MQLNSMIFQHIYIKLTWQSILTLNYVFFQNEGQGQQSNRQIVDINVNGTISLDTCSFIPKYQMLPDYCCSHIS